MVRGRGQLKVSDEQYAKFWDYVLTYMRKHWPSRTSQYGIDVESASKSLGIPQPSLFAYLRGQRMGDKAYMLLAKMGTTLEKVIGGRPAFEGSFPGPTPNQQKAIDMARELGLDETAIKEIEETPGDPSRDRTVLAWFELIQKRHKGLNK